MSPKIPAKVLRKFFIVSSPSSTTVDDCGGLVCAGIFEPEMPETCEDWEACESRRIMGARSISGISTADEAPLKLPCRPIEPTPGVDRSGIGGGAPEGWAKPGKTPEIDERGPADNGAFSSVGLRDVDETEGRDWDLGKGGRQTF